MARRVRKLVLIERKTLSDGSTFERYSEPDKYGYVSFGHETPTGFQMFRTDPVGWLKHYNLKFTDTNT